MAEWCVFCGNDISEGGIVCPTCRPRISDLEEEKRVLIEEIEKDEKARETLRAALVNLAAPLSEFLESLASLMRQFGKKE